MVSREQLHKLVGAVKDPHLPFGLAELGMLERVEFNDGDGVEVVVNIPCHHCPGLQMLRDDIQAALRSGGVTQPVSVSFQGARIWSPDDMSSRARAAMRAAGIQVNSQRKGPES